MQPFEQWFVQLTSMISDLLVGAAAVTGIVGLRTWRRELVGKTRFEAARNMIRLALQFADLYHDARLPGTFTDEHSERKPKEHESPDETRVANEAYARKKRLRHLQDTMQKLNEAKWEAEIVLGKNAAGLIQPLEKAYKELYIAIHIYFNEELQWVREQGQVPQPGDIDDGLRKVIYSRKDDTLNDVVAEAVDDLKDQLKPYVS